MKKALLLLLLYSCTNVKKEPVSEAANDTVKNYYSTGSLKQIEVYNRGIKSGLSRYYFENGNLSGEFFYKDNLKSGPFTTYYEDGTLRTAGYLLNDSTPHGNYFIFDNKGNILERIFYDEGKPIN